MRKKILLLAVVLPFVLLGCTDNFEDLNTDKKNPATVPAEALFSNAQKSLADFLSNTNVNINIYKLMAQYWTETTYIDEANYDIVKRNISANIFSYLYLRVLTDLKEAKKILEKTDVLTDLLEKEKTNKIQIIELLSVYAWQHLVDIFGAVPYSEALNPDNVYPKYDSGEEIYNDLFSRLDAALSKLDPTVGSFGSADLYYEGDVNAWIKFGNSLKIKLAINIAEHNSQKARNAIESAYDKAFSSNADNCLISYETLAPNYNPLYADLVASGRHDFVPANTIVDKMNDFDDPRRAAYFTEFEEGVYKGGKYGYSNSFSQYSHIADRIQKPDFPGILMTYAEICFYLAEAAERGYTVGKTAEEWYNEGIKASFDFWGVDGVDQYLQHDSVNYTTASGDWKRKIGIQSWIANYPNGDVAYTNWRRLDYPILNLPERVDNYSDIPVRFTFPVNEQNLNTENYNAASNLIGGDLLTTKVFWDKY